MKYILVVLFLLSIGCSSVSHSGLNNVEENIINIENKMDILERFGLPDSVIKANEKYVYEILIYNKGPSSSIYTIPFPAAFSHEIEGYIYNIKLKNEKDISNSDLVFFLNKQGKILKYVQK